MKPRTYRRTRTLALGVAVAGALGLGFAAYLNPHLAVELANTMWACF